MLPCKPVYKFDGNYQVLGTAVSPISCCWIWTIRFTAIIDAESAYQTDQLTELEHKILETTPFSTEDTPISNTALFHVI